MKNLLILFIYFLFSCSSYAQKYFKILEATQQSWTGGIKGSGRGTNYQFKLQITTGRAIAFDTIWLNESKFLPEITRGNSRNYKGILTKNDTVSLLVRDFIPDRYQQEIMRRDTAKEILPIKKKVIAPIKYKGEALMRFYINGKEKYVAHKTIKKITPIYYQ